MHTSIIAEAGVNHNGDINLAKEMVEVAAECGADFIKFQTFKADELVTQKASKAKYQQSDKSDSESQYEMLKKLELTSSVHQDLFEHCKWSGIQFLSTAFDIPSADMLKELGQNVFKIASGEITNLPLLRHIGGFNSDVIISSGMSTIKEISNAISAVETAGTKKDQITVLHCTTSYPLPMSDVNLNAMRKIAKDLQVKIGYSDHTLGIEIPIAAVALGAQIVEKHFTLDRELPGPDHRASLIPTELRSMVEAIRNIEVALGDGEKRLMPCEIENVELARKSIVAAKNIRKGEILSEENLSVKRPGLGVSPMAWDEVMGKKAIRDFSRDDLLEL
jgi:N,N'-diacetyllegionaminate synthase